MIRVKIFLLFLLVSAVAFGFLHSPGTLDVGIQMEWNQNVESKGIIAGFSANNDSIYPPYPPLNAVMFFSISKLSRLAGLDNVTGFKITCFIFLILATAIFYWWVKDGFLSAILALTLILCSTAHGYTDIHMTPPLLLSFWALQKRQLELFTLLFGVSCLIKWQPLIIAPIVLLYIVNIQRFRDWRQIAFKEIGLSIVLPAVLLSLLMLSIFGIAVLTAFKKAMHHSWLSGNALNVNWILTYYFEKFRPWQFRELTNGLIRNLTTGDIRIIAIPKLLFFSSYLLSCWLFFRRKKTFSNMLIFSSLAYLSYFMFNTGVHENHLFLVVLLLALLVASDRNFIPDFVIWSIAFNANLYFFYGTDGLKVPFSRVVVVDITLILAFIYLILYILFFVESMKIPIEMNMDRAQKNIISDKYVRTNKE